MRIKELLKDNSKYSLTHEKCGGYVDLEIINDVIYTECRNCHEKQEIVELPRLAEKLEEGGKH